MLEEWLMMEIERLEQKNMGKRKKKSVDEQVHDEKRIYKEGNTTQWGIRRFRDPIEDLQRSYARGEIDKATYLNLSHQIEEKSEQNGSTFVEDTTH